MNEILITAGVFFVVVLLMWAALTFSNYKKDKKSGCCGGTACDSGHTKKEREVCEKHNVNVHLNN